MPAATTTKERENTSHGTMGIVYPDQVDEHIQKYIITIDDKFHCNLCNKPLVLSSIPLHIFGQKHHQAWRLHQQSVPSPSKKTSETQQEVSKQQDRPYPNPIRFTRSTAKFGPAMTSNPLPLPPKLPEPEPIRPLVPKHRLLTKEQILNNLDRLIFHHSNPREVHVGFLTARRLLIQSIGMKEWRALEEKRERAWEVYMSTSSSDIKEASIANKESKESIGTD